MSRGVVYDPVASGGATKVAQPPLVKAIAVAYDPVCAILDGTQTAVLTLPPTH
jgi:hypothetical protein